MRQLAHAEVVDDEQRHGGEVREVALAGAIELGLSDFLEEDVGLAVERAVPLLDGGVPDGLREVALAGARRPCLRTTSRHVDSEADQTYSEAPCAPQSRGA